MQKELIRTNYGFKDQGLVKEPRDLGQSKGHWVKGRQSEAFQVHHLGEGILPICWKCQIVRSQHQDLKILEMSFKGLRRRLGSIDLRRESRFTLRKELPQVESQWVNFQVQVPRIAKGNSSVQRTKREI